MEKVYVLCSSHSLYQKMKARRDLVHPETRGLDVFFDIKSDVQLYGNESTIDPLTYHISLGVTLYPPGPGYDFLLLPRSSSSQLSNHVPLFLPEIDVDAYKKDLDNHGIKFFESHTLELANTVGLIDFDYRGVCQARIQLNKDLLIKEDKPYLQLVSLKECSYVLVYELNQIPSFHLYEVDRDSAGYGTTDLKTRK